jgi:hypothetical protein
VVFVESIVGKGFISLLDSVMQKVIIDILHRAGDSSEWACGYSLPESVLQSATTALVNLSDIQAKSDAANFLAGPARKAERPGADGRHHRALKVLSGKRQTLTDVLRNGWLCVLQLLIISRGSSRSMVMLWTSIMLPLRKQTSARSLGFCAASSC